MLPESSVDVMVTVTDPKSSQSTLFGETVNVGDELQLSTADATSLGLIEPSPLASKETTTGVDTTVIVGPSLSTTVAEIPEYCLTFEFQSVTVTVKLTEPKSSQSTTAGSITTDSIPQLS